MNQSQCSSMDHDERDEEELYSQRLKEVFDSCDLDNKGYINRNEVIDLSQKLQCGEQVPELLRETLGDEFTDGKVTFQQFREGFVTILAKTIDGLELGEGTTTEDEQSEISEFDFTGDQCVPGSPLKKDASVTAKCSKVVFEPPRYEHKYTKERKTSTPRKKPGIPVEKLSLSTSKDEDVSEVRALDAFHNKCCTSARDTIVCGKASQIRQIWDEVAVGQSGCIDLVQLSTICDHIGMDTLNGDDLEMLFVELDADGDGLVSLDEFLTGLFGTETPRGVDGLEGIFEEDNKNCELVLLDEKVARDSDSGTKKRKLPKTTSLDSPGRKKIPTEDVHVALFSPDILSSLDSDNTGTVKMDYVRTYLERYSTLDADAILKGIEADLEDRVCLKKLSKNLERVVLDNGGTLSKLVLHACRDEIKNLRGRLESSGNEMHVLKSNLSKVEVDNNSIMYEGEERMRKERENYEQKKKKLEKSYSDKLSCKQRDLLLEKEKMDENHREEVKQLEAEMEYLRTDLLKTKNQLQESLNENNRFESDYKSSIKELNLERKKFVKMEKELSNSRHLKEKLADLELQLRVLSEVRHEESNRIKELKKMNKELHDQNDEYFTRLEAKVASSDGSHNSSYLSEYFKPDVIEGRHDDSYEEQCEVDRKNAIICQQEESIAALRRDLETVNKLLEENNTMTTERHSHEVNYLMNKYESEITGMQAEIEKERKELNILHSGEKESLVESYEAKIVELRKCLFSANESKKRGDGEEEGSAREGSAREEGSAGKLNDSMEEDYRNEIKKLNKKVVLLATQKAEMELRFLNETAEIEQKFRMERSEFEQIASAACTNREVDQERKYIDFLKEDLSKKHVEFIEEMQRINKKEKHENHEHMQSKLEEYNTKHQREIIELRRTFNLQIAEMEKTFAIERVSLREGFTREKSETEQKHLQEKAELEDVLKQEYEMEMANKLADLQKLSAEERTEVEEGLEQEKYELSINLQHHKAAAERNLRHMKTEMELSFTEEKNQIIKDFQCEKNIMQNKYKREMAELQQAFSGGEAGLKGKMKDDFTKLIDQRRNEWESSFEKERSNLLQSFAHEKCELEMSWSEEKRRMEENFEDERKEWESMFHKEKQELIERFQKQKQSLEDEFLEENKNLRERRDVDIRSRIDRETSLIKQNSAHLETELISLRQQKKELETRNQILELKKLSPKQEAAFQKEKKSINEKVNKLTKEVAQLKADKEKLNADLCELSGVKATILDNSVTEITQQQEQYAHLLVQKGELQDRIEQLGLVECDNVELKHETERLTNELSEKGRVIQSLTEVERMNNTLTGKVNSLNEVMNSSEQRENELQVTLSDRSCKITHLEHEVEHYLEKLQTLQENYLEKLRTLEDDHKKEMDTQRERLNMQSEEANAIESNYIQEVNSLKEQLHKASISSDLDYAMKEKLRTLEDVHKKEMDTQRERLNMKSEEANAKESKYIRELNSLKEQLHKANRSSDRDYAMKDKLFNDAKAELIVASKKLEEKNNKIQELEEYQKKFEMENGGKSAADIQQLKEQIKTLEDVIAEKASKTREERNSMLTKSIRSDTLVTDLYLENADLMKEIANAENNQSKAEKLARQLTDQKRALQRVISKLCHANGISSEDARSSP